MKAHRDILSFLTFFFFFLFDFFWRFYVENGYMWVVRLELASVRLVEINKRKETIGKKVRQRPRFFFWCFLF